MEKKDIHKLLYDIGRLAYSEGRTHQHEDDFPDVGMHWPKKFKDTEIYKIIMENKPKED